jgi:tetratricopeptide (TPR) repeat protein
MQLAYGDQVSQAMPACEDAYNTFLAAGNRLAAADSIRLMADEMGTEGHYGQALATYQRALTLLAGLGEHEKTGAVLNNMAINFANQGRLGEAEKLYSEAKVHFEQAGDKPNTATAMSNVADVLYSKGNLPAAAKLYRETLDFLATIDHGDPGYALYRLADLRLAQGDVKAAQHLAEEAVEAIRPTQGGYQYLSSAMNELGEALETEGDLAGARAQFEQTLATRQKLGAEQLAAESQVELANLAIEEGHGEQAEALLRAALAEFEKEKTDPDSSSAWTSLSRALRIQGKLEEARKSAERGAELSLTSSDPLLRLPAEIEQARVDMASAAGAQLLAAQKRLNLVITTAHRLGYYNIESQARLALGECELKTSPAVGRKHLAALASETRSRGLELVARHAEDAASKGAVVAQTRLAH